MINISYKGCAHPLTLTKLLLADLCSPCSLDLLTDLENNDYNAFFRKDIAEYDNDSPRDFAIDYLALSILKKNPCLVSDNLENEALLSFLKSEEQCKETNRRLAETEKGISRFDDEFFIAKGKISAILGSLPHKALNFGFGPGVSIGRKGVDTGHYAKYSVFRPSITSKAVPFAECYLKGTLWSDFLSRGLDSKINFEIVEHAEVAFVPKNYKSKRTIAIEPLMNTYFQKGLGSYIRDRLSFAGVDLSQQTHNQDAASNAITGELATIDFKSASDTISSRVVLDLLPIDWYLALDMFRTDRVKLKDGSFHFLQKFSSMGNGFTFELESLLFYAAAYAVVKLGSGRIDDIYVYGDDVIIPKVDYARFREFTEYLGFTVNTEKSFYNGDFYESCGADFYRGVNVRPFFLKNDLRSDNDIFECHNSLLRFSERWKVDFGRALGFLQSLVARERHLYVPFPYSGGFHKSLDRDRGITDQGWEGSFHKCLVYSSKKMVNELYEASVLSSFSSPGNGFRPLRGVGNWKVKRLFFPAAF